MGQLIRVNFKRAKRLKKVSSFWDKFKLIIIASILGLAGIIYILLGIFVIHNAFK